MLSLEPVAQLRERQVVDCLYLVDQGLFEPAQFERHVAALHAWCIFSKASSPRACSGHIRMTHAKARSNFSNTALSTQYAIA